MLNHGKGLGEPPAGAECKTPVLSGSLVNEIKDTSPPSCMEKANEEADALAKLKVLRKLSLSIGCLLHEIFASIRQYGLYIVLIVSHPILMDSILLPAYYFHPLSKM